MSSINFLATNIIIITIYYNLKCCGITCIWYVQYPSCYWTTVMRSIHHRGLVVSCSLWAGWVWTLAVLRDRIPVNLFKSINGYTWSTNQEILTGCWEVTCNELESHGRVPRKSLFKICLMLEELVRMTKF